MNLHWIVAARKDKQGRVTQVRWGKAHGISNRVPAVRTVAIAREVARVIECGDQVMTLFRANKWTLPMPGARLMRTLDTSHGEWIATEDPQNHAGKTLEDLPSF